MIKLFAAFATGVIVCAVLGAVIFFSWGNHKMTKVHKLEFPLLLTTEDALSNSHLLPKGTTLYFDKAYPEGFTSYKIYINIDRMPLALTELSDPTLIDPLEARALDKDDLKKILLNYPLTKSDLESILKSGKISKDEIKEVLTDFLR
jgi:hypothetical protein